MTSISNQKIHIVSFDVPFPADYGGVIDVFYKIKALAEIGFSITLHCFQYGRSESAELDKYCTNIIYYKRRRNPLKLFKNLPFIVSTRNNDALLKNLMIDDSPILFEGLHCCYFLSDSMLSDRFKMVRMHNVEWAYYYGLSDGETNFFKKIYFKREAKRLSAFESILNFADNILSISAENNKYFEKKYGSRAVLINGFHSNRLIEIGEQESNVCLYHGNLSVNENINAVMFLVETFKNTKIKICIAGKNPSESLQKHINRFPNFELIKNPTDKVLDELIQKCKINLLPFMVNEGAKIKLINTLYKGRFVISNIEDELFKDIIVFAKTPWEWIAQVDKLLNEKFNNEYLDKRQSVLYDNYNDIQNAKTIACLLP